jgi:hypothetical protein
MALGPAIRQAMATLEPLDGDPAKGLRERGRGRPPPGRGGQYRSPHNLLLSTIFLAPALAVSHFRPETRQSRRSRRGFLR